MSIIVEILAPSVTPNWTCVHTWGVIAMLMFVLRHAQGANALPTSSSAIAAVEIAKDAYWLSVVATIIAGTMLLIALLDFFFKMKDRLEVRRWRVKTALPRNAVNDVNATHAHTTLGQYISPGDCDLEAQRQLEPINSQAVKRVSTTNPSHMPSERPSRRPGSSATRSESSEIGSCGLNTPGLNEEHSS